MKGDDLKAAWGVGIILTYPAIAVVVAAVCFLIGCPLKWANDRHHAEVEANQRRELERERALNEETREWARREETRPKTSQDFVISLLDRRVEFHPSTNPEDYVLRRMAQDDRQYWNYQPPDRDRWLREDQEKRRQKGEIPDFTPAQLAAIRARRLPHSFKDSIPLEFQDINSGMVERSKVWSFLIVADDWVAARKVAIDQGYPAVAVKYRKEEVRNEDPNRGRVYELNLEKDKALKRAWEDWLDAYDTKNPPPRWETWVTPTTHR